MNALAPFGGQTADGTGQTIAIVDAFNDPNILSELDGFDQATYLTSAHTQNLNQQYGAASSILTVYNQTGQNVTSTFATSVYTTSLTTAITTTSGPTTITVTSAAGISVNDVLQIDSEQMMVTGISGSTLTVTRGVNGTAADKHLNGYLVNDVTLEGNVPAVDSTPPGPSADDWEQEEALDVEWAHAIAPGSKIDLIEANSDSDLYSAVLTAAGLPDVSVVSMSWGALSQHSCHRELKLNLTRSSRRLPAIKA